MLKIKDNVKINKLFIKEMNYNTVHVPNCNHIIIEDIKMDTLEIILFNKKTILYCGTSKKKLYYHNKELFHTDKTIIHDKEYYKYVI